MRRKDIIEEIDPRVQREILALKERLDKVEQDLENTLRHSLSLAESQRGLMQQALDNFGDGLNSKVSEIEDLIKGLIERLDSHQREVSNYITGTRADAGAD